MDHQSRCVRFEQFEVDCTTGELTRAGSRVTRLQEQPRLVPDALLSPPGRLVSREELHGLLWPRDALVDAENGLNIAINKIRIALGDSATKPRFIETIPRRGYRFITAVLPINEQPLSDGPADHSTAPLVTPIPTLVQSSEPPAPSPVKSSHYSLLSPSRRCWGRRATARWLRTPPYRPRRRRQQGRPRPVQSPVRLEWLASGGPPRREDRRMFADSNRSGL